MRKLLVVLAVSLAAVSGCSKQADKESEAAAVEAKLPKLTVDEVDRMIAAKEIVPVDCNGASTRKRSGVVPGAVLVTDNESYAAAELPADKTTKLVFYCANPACHACHVGAVRAKSLGYANVYVMPEGIAGWVKAGKTAQMI